MNSNPLVHIVIDDRERGSTAAVALLGMDGLACEVRRLKVGDYLVDGRLVVERKTLLDLVSSIEDGRLFRQAIALAGSQPSPLLILEGRSSDLGGIRMRREAVQGALVTVSVILGIPVLRATDGQETARLLIFAARQIRRTARGAVHRPGSRPRGKRKLQFQILQGLPGVGPGRAGLLLDRFRTVEAVFTAAEEDLLGVEGIGKTTARKIRWAVRDRRSPYRADPAHPAGSARVPC
jgi:DNA excision repair protein ERCC-4